MNQGAIAPPKIRIIHPANAPEFNITQRELMQLGLG